MAFPDFSLKDEFSWSVFCSLGVDGRDSWKGHLGTAERAFLRALHLPRLHPACLPSRHTDTSSLPPSMGPLKGNFCQLSAWDVAVINWNRVMPALLAAIELWLRLFAALAPLGLLILVWNAFDTGKLSPTWRSSIPTIIMLTVASSVVLSTDSLYVHEFGSEYGLSLLAMSSLFSLVLCHRCARHDVAMVVAALGMLTVFLGWDSNAGGFRFGGSDIPRAVEEGLYYSFDNEFVSSIVSHWPVEFRTYSSANGATPWMPTGDARTGLPFWMNTWRDLQLTKVWLPTKDEAIRLDISFPPNGHDHSKPIYLILHGINGGSHEEFVKDLVHRATAKGSTTVIMVARGLMDTPIRGWNSFHGARVSDLEAAARVLRKALGPDQILVGVGYSMGAVILSNYVSRSGKHCYLDAAIPVSGGLDARPQMHYHRARRLWQPFIVLALRDQFILGKFGERYRERLTNNDLVNLMKATDVTGVDMHGFAAYNGYEDVVHYYSEMSAMGDIPQENPPSLGRITNLSVPTCLLTALDDPVATWRVLAANEGHMHPNALSQSGSGHLMLLLTKRGGHVGWPLGWNPSVHKWLWMSRVVMSFADAVNLARKNDAFRQKDQNGACHDWK